ncbi:MAG: roadblock/LC7 domain-containing protein [Alphaproteobacteria bacterium]|nr:roadblock/LC7 domain-containing protein [Alphaproteobacteria bacterium]MCB9796088.1 roadblock/LC7 domain-containing protein [Alphaproteobacteria bacterium]
MNAPQTSLLDELLFINSDILAASLVGVDGAVHDHRGQDDAGLSALGAMLAVVAGRAVTELGRGMMRSVLVEGDEGFVVVEPVGDAQVVAVVAHRGAAPGLVISDVRASIRAASAQGAS